MVADPHINEEVYLANAVPIPTWLGILVIGVNSGKNKCLK